MKDELVKGFDKEGEEKEEMRKYGIKQKQKKKTRINLIINIILGIILFLVMIWIFYLKSQINQKDYKIKVLLNQKNEMINYINEGKEEINRLSLQNQNVQNKAFVLLEKCFNDTDTLRNQIMDLKKQAEENKQKNKFKDMNYPSEPEGPKDRLCIIF